MTDTIVRGGAVARGRLDGDQLRDVQVIWRQEPKTLGRGHFGNRILFAPDGKMFITSGERMRFDPAQSLVSNLGSIVTIPLLFEPENQPTTGDLLLVSSFLTVCVIGFAKLWCTLLHRLAILPV